MLPSGVWKLLTSRLQQAAKWLHCKASAALYDFQRLGFEIVLSLAYTVHREAGFGVATWTADWSGASQLNNAYGADLSASEVR